MFALKLTLIYLNEIRQTVNVELSPGTEHHRFPWGVSSEQNMLHLAVGYSLTFDSQLKSFHTTSSVALSPFFSTTHNLLKLCVFFHTVIPTFVWMWAHASSMLKWGMSFTNVSISSPLTILHWRMFHPTWMFAVFHLKYFKPSFHPSNLAFVMKLDNPLLFLYLILFPLTGSL